jgi:hypothetical protein
VCALRCRRVSSILERTVELKVLKQSYFFHVHSMFWGNLPLSRSIIITQKRIARIMRAKAKDSCKEMFSKLGILTLCSFFQVLRVLQSITKCLVNLEF